MDDFRTPEELFAESKEKIRKAGQDFKKYIPLFIIIFLSVSSFKGMIYSIGPDETGVIQRFGKYVRSVEPGLHFKIPFGIENVTPVKVKKIFKEEFGFRTIVPDVRSQYSEHEYYDESLMLTGDLNILDVQWIVQFKVIDPVKLLFYVRDPSNNIRNLCEVIMSRLCGDYTVDELLTSKREEIDHKADTELQKLFDRYNTGLQVVTVKLLDVNPPNEVKPAFNEVNEARQERERMINEAWEEYNKIIPRAKGEAEQMISEAEGYALDKINRAHGETERFLSILEEYKKSPAVTRERIYLENMTEVLSKIEKKYIVSSNEKSILPFIDLGKNKGE
ncbi:HflK [Candidatus Omnitrophus magneticus]|uniref:Protein HflK n=1 Tax=Candidatus Omnitrophus magneticus TaxID=1609969 RepID=A0A0F0CRV8_9BACT|nr:HflK [Candidatus Omnitrophus magneticus]